MVHVWSKKGHETKITSSWPKNNMFDTYLNILFFRVHSLDQPSNDKYQNNWKTNDAHSSNMNGMNFMLPVRPWLHGFVWRMEKQLRNHTRTYGRICSHSQPWKRFVWGIFQGFQFVWNGQVRSEQWSLAMSCFKLISKILTNNKNRQFRVHKLTIN